MKETMLIAVTTVEVLRGVQGAPVEVPSGEGTRVEAVAPSYWPPARPLGVMKALVQTSLSKISLIDHVGELTCPSSGVGEATLTVWTAQLSLELRRQVDAVEDEFQEKFSLPLEIRIRAHQGRGAGPATADDGEALGGNTG